MRRDLGAGLLDIRPTHRVLDSPRTAGFEMLMEEDFGQRIPSAVFQREGDVNKASMIIEGINGRYLQGCLCVRFLGLGSENGVQLRAAAGTDSCYWVQSIHMEDV